MDRAKETRRNLGRLLLNKDVYGILDGDVGFPTSSHAEEHLPYLSGPVLSDLSNTFGVPSEYCSQSRWVYVEDMMQDAIDKGRLSDLLNLFFTNPQFGELLKDVPVEDFERRHNEIVSGAVGQINKKLFFGGHELRSVGGRYDVVPRGGSIHVTVPNLKIIDRAYVRDISKRALEDIDGGRLDSALTEARTILEEIFCYAIEQRGHAPNSTGDIRGLFNQVGDLYHMHESKDFDRRVNSLLGGLNKVIDSISSMRNNEGDAHGHGAQRIGIRDYHARLAVNSAATVAEFVLSVIEAAK